VIGWLFKKAQYRDTKTELLLFVTPRIIVKP
jgi:type II secretory pathway component HofQ